MAEARATILAVDDTPENLDILVGLLEGQYKVKVATNGERALRMVAKAAPDLVLLDIMMPGMDGFEVCRRLRDEEETREIPVLFISALDQVTDKVRAFTSGGVDYITKPFQAEEVEARVATHLELRRQRRQLEESFERLQELERLRDSLVHMVVHDLRSPLYGMCAGMQMLREDAAERLEPDEKEYLDDTLAAGTTLIEMVSSLLDVSRLESGEMSLTQEDGDLREVIGEGLVALGALTSGCTVLYDAGEDPVRAYCDAEVIRRVLVNLVGNALKFTPAGGEVRITTEADSGYVKTSVIDTGPGIPPEWRERIFEKFGQVAAREEHGHHSTGLGLTFCKLAVEAHGGTIGVDSEVGKGSTFWFSVPTAALDRQEQ